MARFYASQMVVAIDSIHKLGYVHRSGRGEGRGRDGGKVGREGGLREWEGGNGINVLV